MKIVVLSCHTSSLFWFRLDMMKEFINKGHDVIALGSDPEVVWKERFSEYDIEYRQLYVERNAINPFKDLKTLIELYFFVRREKPDKVFVYQAKTIIYGSIAAKLNGIFEVYLMIAGLGSIFRGTGLKNEILKLIMKIEFRTACKCSKKVFFHNNNDKEEFINKKIINNDQAVIINGSGVNLEKFQPVPLSEEPVFLFIGRLIKDKGVMEYLRACKAVKANYPYVRCLLVGPYDSNPSALKPEEIQPYINDGTIEYFGEQSDVRPFIAQCTTYVLPSYHEGRPKTVLEAMAMGRPIITSDAPGCRDTVKDGENGFLVKVKDVEGLVRKMTFCIEEPNIVRKMGIKNISLSKEKYDVKIVNHVILQTMGLI